MTGLVKFILIKLEINWKRVYRALLRRSISQLFEIIWNTEQCKNNPNNDNIDDISI